MRRSISILAIVLILAIAWSGGWYALARYAEHRADAGLKELAANGVEVDCRDREIGGFPFALRVVCGPTAIAQPAEDVRTQLAGVSAGVSVFAPLTGRIAMTAPVAIRSPTLAGPAALRFDDAAFDVGIWLNGPRDYAFDTTNLVAEFTIPEEPTQTIAAATAEGSLALSEDAGSDIALRFTDFSFSAGPTRFPAFSGSLEGELSVPPRALLSGEAGLQAPISARGIEIRLESGGAQLDIDGDLAIDAEGVIDGTVIFRVAGAEKLPAFIAALPEEWQKHGNAIAGGLLILGSPTTIDGEPASEMKIEIERGETRIGPVPLSLPRVPL